jgi:hypothetical protein
MFGAIKDIGKPGSAMRWLFHAVLFVATLTLLAFIQYHYEIGRYVSAPHPYLRQAWLPLLGFLVYVNIWLLWLVWRLYDPKPGPSQWQDIDFTWEMAATAIARSGIDPSRVPLFLVLGRPASGFGVLFDAAHIPLEVNGVPESQLAPLQVFAGKQAVFIVSADTCLLGAFADRLSAQTQRMDMSRLSNIDPKASMSNVPVPPTDPAASNPSTKTLPPDAATESAHAEAIPDVIMAITRDAELLTRMNSRLDHLCRLIRGMRHPWCTLNGVLMVLPEMVTADTQLATQAAILAQRDLLAVIESSGVECPAVLLFSDAEKILGFREFLSLVPKDKRDQRLGKPIPLALNQAAEKRADIMRRTIYWQCAELIPKLITRTFQIRTIDPASGVIKSGSGIDARTNRQLVRLIGTMWARRRVMGDLCTRILGDNTVRPLRLAGCYFAATGSNRNAQGFLAELFAQIFEGQNFVVWTHDAARAETTLMRVVYTGYALTALVTVATLALAAVVWHQS